MRLWRQRSEERCVGLERTCGSPAVRGLQVEGGTEPLSSSQRALAAASSTTVPPGSRLVGVVGESYPSARLDEENPLELLQASCGLTTARPVKWPQVATA